MTAKAFEFGNFRVDADERTLLDGGHPVALTPKAFDTLLLLVENAGRLMEKEAMMERLWPGTFVEEANLANNISLLRKALGEQANAIQTVPRRGYRFVADVRPVDSQPVAVPKPMRWPYIVAAAILGVMGGLLAGRALWRHEPATFRQVTFRRGIISGARFEPDGQTIVYSASYEGRPQELFVTRADQRESRPLGIAGNLLAVSKHGDLAILTRAGLMGYIPVGTLARLPITGGAPRELADNVQEADWSPDGESLAVIRWSGPLATVEYPINHVIYRGAPPMWFNGLRVSPSGDEVAFLLHESQRFDDRGRAVVVDRNGRIVRSSRVFPSASGLAWTRDGELRISAVPSDVNNALYAVDGRGDDRVLARTAGRLLLFDVAPSGAALVADERDAIGIRARTAGEANERDLSWLDGSWMRDISADGRTLLFDEEASGGGATAHVYIRPIDGAPAADLGEGHAVVLSPDGQWALARQRFTNPPRLILFHTGAGEPRPLPTGNIEATERAAWLGPNRIVFVGNEPHRPPRTFLLDLASGRIAPVTPEGVTGTVATPDGTALVARSHEWALWPIAGGAPMPLRGVTQNDFPQRFGRDGRTLFVSTAATIDRIDVVTGSREVLNRYAADKPPGCVYVAPARVSADGRAYAYTYFAMSMDLFDVEGLR